MLKKRVNLNSIDDIKEFVNIVNRFPVDVDLSNGRYVIDAKSIMGIFSLDLSKDIDCTIHGNESECDEVAEAIKAFCV